MGEVLQFDTKRAQKRPRPPEVFFNPEVNAEIIDLEQARFQKKLNLTVAKLAWLTQAVLIGVAMLGPSGSTQKNALNTSGTPPVYMMRNKIDYSVRGDED